MQPLSFDLDTAFLEALPADPEPSKTPRQVTAAYAWVEPTPVAQPQLLAYSAEVAEGLGIKPTDITQPAFAATFCGNLAIAGARPYACNYGGHQFGHWAGQLGDGRAINLATINTPEAGRQILQLKGAGLTPYSRTADGRAVLRSSLREFLCSEAMYHLGIPTTRALSLCLTGDQVVRDMFYDGRPAAEPGAIVCRVSSSFTRFGSFQLPASRGDLAQLEAWVRYTLAHDYPELGEYSPSSVIELFNSVCRRSADLVLDWMRVGFVHGVLNTDNLSIIGETIDYGPYGWLESYDPDWTPNTTDAEGKRYAYGQQPQIVQWNLFQLANALYPLVNDPEPFQQALADYATRYHQQSQQMLAGKLGLRDFITPLHADLIDQHQALLQSTEVDMTRFYRLLGTLEKHQIPTQAEAIVAHFADALYQPDTLSDDSLNQWQTWLAHYSQALQHDDREDAERQAAMNATNPCYVLRNYLAQEAIDAVEQGDLSLLHELQTVLQTPYQEQAKYARFAQKRPEWARNKAGCSMLSCSS